MEEGGLRPRVAEHVRTCQCSSVAQWQSIRLLTGGLLVRVQPEEPISFGIPTAFAPRRSLVEDVALFLPFWIWSLSTRHRIKKFAAAAIGQKSQRRRRRYIATAVGSAGDADGG